MSYIGDNLLLSIYLNLYVCAPLNHVYFLSKLSLIDVTYHMYDLQYVAPDLGDDEQNSTSSLSPRGSPLGSPIVSRGPSRRGSLVSRQFVQMMDEKELKHKPSYMPPRGSDIPTNYADVLDKYELLFARYHELLAHCESVTRYNTHLQHQLNSNAEQKDPPRQLGQDELNRSDLKAAEALTHEAAYQSSSVPSADKAWDIYYTRVTV